MLIANAMTEARMVFLIIASRVKNVARFKPIKHPELTFNAANDMADPLPMTLAECSCHLKVTARQDGRDADPIEKRLGY